MKTDSIESLSSNFLLGGPGDSVPFEQSDVHRVIMLVMLGKAEASIGLVESTDSVGRHFDFKAVVSHFPHSSPACSVGVGGLGGLGGLGSVRESKQLVL